jgi:hypothetical protein
MSEVKVNKISPRSGTEVTLGDSGDTFTIPSGATINNQGTATNFGATGAVSWTTTVKTAGFTAVAGEGYFVDTTSGAISVNLPAGTAGAVVGFKDYANTFDTNAVTLVQNGSDKIGGATANKLLATEGQAVTLVFIDSTQGWLVTDDGLQSSVGSGMITATGGTETISGNCKIHTFTGPGTFTVSKVAICSANNAVAYMVIAGGGSGGSNGGGGGGGGGFREGRTNPITPYTASPLVTTGLTVTAQSYPITIGAGGTAAAATPTTGSRGTSGGTSTFSTITSAGGGAGGGFFCASSPLQPGNSPGAAGGSGGGGGAQNDGVTTPGGAGNTPSVSPPQGNSGGSGIHVGGCYVHGGGAGGATAAGTNQTNPKGGDGGAGATSSINGTPTARAGGAGGAGFNPRAAGTPGGGGAGTSAGAPPAPTTDGTAGTANTGGGGGAGSHSQNCGANGGSGIVIIRYKFQ